MNVSDIKENTGHDAKGSGGFEYQFLYFIRQLLKMQEKDEMVAYEKHDDVSKITGEGITYFQLKHTIGGTNVKPVNLRLRDSDLWKTIAVWIDITLSQKEESQIVFWENNRFVLVTNKMPDDNEFWTALQRFQKDEISFEELKKFYQKVYDETKDPAQEEGKPKRVNQTKVYIKSLIDFEYAERLLKSMTICFEPDLKMKILDSLEYNKSIPKAHVEKAFHELLGELKDKWFSDKKASYSRDDFSKLIGRICNKYRERKFLFKQNTVTLEKLPSDLLEQIFIQQLMDVEDIDESDTDLIVDYTQQKFDYINNIQEAIKNEEVSNSEIEKTINNAFLIWQQKFRLYMKHARIEDKDDIIDRAAQLLNDIRDKRLDFVEETLPVYFSNGCFYYLSDKDTEHEPRIGWRPGWEDKYLNHG